MFCNRCGAQVEPLDNFCKNCGVRLSRSAEDLPADHNSINERRRVLRASARPNIVGSGSTAERVPFPRGRERKSNSAMTMTIAVGVLVIAVASGLYFGTESFREPPRPNSSSVAKAPGSSLSEETRRPGESSYNNSTSFPQSQPYAPSPSAPIELPNPSWEQSPKPLPDINTSESPDRKAPVQSRQQQSASTTRPGKAPASTPTSRRAPGVGTYETTGSAPVFESPSDSSQIMANIPAGTRVDVVSAKGDWLEVHSRRGNPPGFIRRQDARFLDKTD